MQKLRSLGLGLALLVLLGFAGETLWRNWNLGRNDPSAPEGLKFGFIDKTGAFVIEPRFKLAYDFSEGFAPVCTEDGTGFIDRTGALVIPPVFENAGSFSEGLAQAQADGRIGYIDTSGEWVIPPRYSRAGVFSQGLAPAAIDGPYGFIDRTGEWAIPPRFTRALPFTEDRALVVAGGACGYVNPDGDLVIPPTFDAAGVFSGGQAHVRLGQRWVVIDTKGDPVDEARDEMAPALNRPGPMPVTLHWAYVDSTGASFAAPRGPKERRFSEGLAPLEKDGRFGYIDRAGRWAIPPSFQRAYPFRDGLARVRMPAGE